MFARFIYLLLFFIRATKDKKMRLKWSPTEIRDKSAFTLNTLIVGADFRENSKKVSAAELCQKV